MNVLQSVVARAHLRLKGLKPKAPCPRCGFSFLAHEYPEIEWDIDDYPCNITDQMLAEQQETEQSASKETL